LLARQFDWRVFELYELIEAVGLLVGLMATMDMFSYSKDVAMKVMSARDAKNHFGEFLDSARREPVVVTKNDRPVGIMVSIEDAADTLLADFFMEKEPGYDAWLSGKVTRTMARVDSGATGLHEHDDAMALLKSRLESRVRKAG
jgi:prevent-host-death family protein